MNALTFHDTQFEIIDRNNQPWLRLLQIGGALGYSKADLIGRIYQKHADEFTDSMTALVKLPTSGGEQEVRIFSLRGAWLLGMHSRTQRAKEFRAWVLDVLEQHLRQQEAIVALHSPALAPEQQAQLHEAIAAVYPQGRHRAGAWSRFNNHFRISSYKQLPPERMEEALAYIATMPPAKPFKPVSMNLSRELNALYKQAPLFPHTNLFNRWLVHIDEEGRPQMTPIPDDAVIMTPEKLLKAICTGDDLNVTPEQLCQFVMDATARISQMMVCSRGASQTSQPPAGLRLTF